MADPGDELKIRICRWLKWASSFFNQQGAMTVVFVVFALVVACIYYTSASKEPEFFCVLPAGVLDIPDEGSSPRLSTH